MIPSSAVLLPALSVSSQPLPLILLTDFGLADPYAGQVKGVLARHAPGAPVIDLCHDLPPFAIESGAWLLGRSLPHMPAAAVWLCVVDPGVGSGRRALAVQSGSGFFVGPDNGLLTPVLADPASRVVVELPGADAAGVSPTFHGRDLFAPVAARLALGAGLEAVGTPLTTPPVLLSDPGWGVRDGGWRARVMLVDRYGNLVTALPGAELRGRRVRGRIAGRPCGALVPTFSGVEPGASALVVGGFGTVEVVVNQGSAAALFACGAGAELQVEDL